ncbi:MAG: hypothetical protein J7K61_06020 [Thermoplasmata archaeon]|nr:hypothetical protein [Thermoplasmata archaeon]
MKNVVIIILAVAALSINATAYQHAIILSTDYTNSSLSIIDTTTYSIKKDIASSHGDDVVKYYNGKIYVVNRYGYDYIQVFDANMHEIDNWKLEKDSNPHDIAIVNGKAYITCYDKSHMLVLNADDGNLIKKIDLSQFADTDGLPEANKMAVFNNRIFVTLQCLDRNNYYTPSGESYLVVIDTSTDSVERAIKLLSTNPFSSPVIDGMYIYVDEVGRWGIEDGGIEKINALNYNSMGFVIDENTAGGDIVDFDISPKHEGIAGMIIQFLEDIFNIHLIKQRMWIVTSDSSFKTHLILYDFNSINEIYHTNSYSIVDIACNGKNAWVADRESNGIKIFDEDGNMVNELSDVSSYPPVHITFMP